MSAADSFSYSGYVSLTLVISSDSTSGLINLLSLPQAVGNTLNVHKVYLSFSGLVFAVTANYKYVEIL
jgi:hypothetical protein